MKNGLKLSGGKLGFLFALSFCFIALFAVTPVSAAGSITVTEINYDTNTITLKANTADQQINFSDAKMSKWLVVPGLLDSQKQVKFDISWLSPSKENTLTFRGNISTEPITLKIPKRVTRFKAAYSMSDGSISFTNLPDGGLVEWRKVGTINWKPYNAATMKKELDPFYNNGATLYFRVSGKNGTSVQDPGVPPSNESAIKISKRTNAPSIIIDGSRFIVTLKKGMAYKRTVSDDWTTITTTEKKVFLDEIAPEMMAQGSTKGQDVSLDFRVNASSKGQESRVTTIIVSGQEAAMPSSNCNLLYTSANGFSIKVTAASGDNLYEATLVNQGQTPDYNKAVWTTIQSEDYVNFQKENGSIKDIYVRKKSKGSTNSGFTLASASLKIPVADSFPAYTPEFSTTRITQPFGYGQNLTISVQNAGSSGNIKQVLIAGKEIPFTGSGFSVVLPFAKLWESLSSYSLRGGELPVKVLLDNGEIVSGLILELLPASRIKTGTESSFKQILGSNNNSITLTLQFGSKPSGSYPQISSNGITCNGIALPISPSAVDTANGTQTVEIGFQGLTGVVANQSYNITISLSNGELLSGIASVVFEPIASFGENPITLSFTEGSFDRNLELEMLLHEKAANAEITGIVWNSRNLNFSYVKTGRKVNLSIPKADMQILSAGAAALQVKFDNAAEVKEGYRFNITSPTRSSRKIRGNSEELTILSAPVPQGSSYLSSRAVPAGPLIKSIDYDEAVIRITKNGSQNVYYSTDQKNWFLIEDANQTSLECTFDISWISSSRATKLYFSGEAGGEGILVTLPAYNSKFSAKFNKVTGEVEFKGTEESETIQWKKLADRGWNTVDVSNPSDSDAMVEELDLLRTKGGKLLFRIAPVSGGNNDAGEFEVGSRPSREVKLSVSKRGTQPNVKLDMVRGIFKTTDKYEYLNTTYAIKEENWLPCSKNMKVSSVAAQAMMNGTTPGTDVVILFRKAATSRSPYSLSTAVLVPGQTAPPTVGAGCDISYSYNEKGIALSFTKASKTTPYEYAITLGSAGVNERTKWKSVTKSERDVILTKKKVPNGAKIHVRGKGIKENIKKGIEPTLYTPSEVIIVSYPA